MAIQLGDALGTARRTMGNRTWLGRALVLLGVLAAMLALDAADAGVSGRMFPQLWQLLDVQVLADDPFGSVLHLHTQPPIYNLVVGLLLALPVPIVGALNVLYGTFLTVAALLLHDLLVRRGVGPVVAGFVVAAATLQPSLLATIRFASYEVPVALLLVATVWSIQRYLETPTTGWLLAVSAVLTTAVLTRSLLHPIWSLALLGICWLARPVTRRQLLWSLLIPGVLVGGWVLKNQVMFGEPTLSSWQGFNLQRGVVASMERDEVEEAVADGDVSELALLGAWGRLDMYEQWTEGCEPSHGHRAATARSKRNHPTWANYNHECFIPVYEQARSDALALMRREPMRYLAMRVPTLASSYELIQVQRGDRATWMDRLFDPLHVRARTTLHMEDWNLPFWGAGARTYEISLLLVALSLFVLGRGGLAAVRLVRLGVRDRADDWPTDEVVWLVVMFTVGWVVVGGDLVEFGENRRFRSSVDPLLLALPLGALANFVAQSWQARRSAARSGDS